MKFDLPNKRPLSEAQFRHARATLSENIAKSDRESPWSHFHAKGRAALAFGLILGAVLLAPGVGAGRILDALGLTTPEYAALEQEWRNALDEGAKSDPNSSFANLSPDEFRSRLDAAAQTDRFSVESVTLLQPRGLAPMIVVRTDEPSVFAKAVPELLRSIDPKAPGDDTSGWAFEGIFLKALDGTGDPFLLVYNHWRGADAGGGQWARSPELLPFAHG